MKDKFVFDNIEVIEDIWFGPLGIVKAIDTLTEEIKFYIGLGDCDTYSKDVEKIVKLGTKYDRTSFKKLVSWLNDLSK